MTQILLEKKVVKRWMETLVSSWEGTPMPPHVTTDIDDMRQAIEKAEDLEKNK